MKCHIKNRGTIKNLQNFLLTENRKVSLILEGSKTLKI